MRPPGGAAWGVGLRPPPLVRGDWSAASGYQAGRQLAADPSVTAVFCANDEMAFGFMRALLEQGRRGPQDVSGAGLDDIDLSEFASPPLTTIRSDFRRIGYELVRLVLAQLRNEDVVPRDRVVVPTELVARGTTAPPPS